MFDLGRSFLAAVERRPQATAISDGSAIVVANPMAAANA